MTLTLRLAWRNLWRHSRRTWLTAMAMVFSNVLLVFMVSLQVGSYAMMIENTLKSFNGFIQVQAAGYLDNPKLRRSVPGVVALGDRIRDRLQQDGVPAAVTARAVGFALASSEQRSFGIQVVGVQPSREPAVSSIPGLIKAGRYLETGDQSAIVLGAVMARNLKVDLGDEVTLLGSGRDGSFAAGIAVVTGIFESGSSDMDRSLAEVPLAWFQDMFAMGDQGNEVVVSLGSIDATEAAMHSIDQVVAGRDDLVTLDWERLYPGLRQAIQADMTSAWFTYSVLVVLVAFSVLNTQLMSVMERTREFGVISALGVRPRRLATLVVLETALMALIGLVLGVLLGWLLTQYYHVHGFSYPGMDELAERFNLPGAMYPSITPLSLLLGPLVVFVFSLLASAYPALRLFRLRPVAAMQVA